jgi:arylsulfatase A-like enzyme
MARRRGRGLLWGVCVSLLLAGCSSPRPLPNVLLIVVDTLRVDRLGYGGGRRELTPFLDELAARGVAFRNAYTPASWTPPAVASLLTSRYPLQHRVAHYDSQLAESEVTLAEKLGALHYASAGFSANLYIREQLGYAQGFDHWQSFLKDPGGGVKPRANRIRASATAWVREQLVAAEELSVAERRPLFLYLHYLDPHSPYGPPEPYLTRFRRAAGDVDDEIANTKLRSFRFNEIDSSEIELLESLYDGEVAYLDSELRRLFEELERNHFLDNTIVVVTSDHGEEFREHGMLLHGLTLFQAGIQVPLILVAPGLAGGRIVEESVSTLDVAATLLDLLGQPPDPGFEGRTLTPLLDLKGRAPLSSSEQASATEAREILLELAPKSGPRDVRRHAWGMIRGSSKLLVDPAGGSVVYDLEHDPNEASPNPADGAQSAAELLVTLAERREELSLRMGPGSEPARIDDATRAQLRALGYAVDAAADD